MKVDRVLHDGDEVKLGDAVLTARLTPGHTKGCTTWTMKAIEGGKPYNVVIVGSPNVNAGYKLVNNKLYPQIAADYERTFRVLKSLACDVFLGAHGDYYGFERNTPAESRPGKSVHRPRRLQSVCRRSRSRVSRGVEKTDGEIDSAVNRINADKQ